MKRKYGKKEKILIGIVAVVVVVASIIATTVNLSKGTLNILSDDVTESEIEKYKNMIGNNMDIKKAVLILFDSYDECKSFIAEHGGKDNPHEQGVGTVPYMPEGYYNIVGKSKLEEFFDAVHDGEYTKEPLEYSGMFCYMKRICVDSIIDNEEELKKLIIQDREQAKKNK